MTGSLRMALVVAAALVPAPAAFGAGSTGGSSSLYPGSKLAISLSKNARTNHAVTVTFSGTNVQFTQGAPITYSLVAFVQSRSALPSCAPSYDEEFNTFSNLGASSIIMIATNLNEGLQGPFKFHVKYRTGAVRRFVVCAYT